MSQAGKYGENDLTVSSGFFGVVKISPKHAAFAKLHEQIKPATAPSSVHNFHRNTVRD